MAACCAVILTFFPTDAHAQRRGRAVGRGRVVASPVYAGFGFYDPFYWGWGWGPSWGIAGWYPPFGPAYAGVQAGSARLQITPKEAEVYVDGYLAGSVDDFDGFFQRLDVMPGAHELTIYLEGFRTITQQVFFQPGQTLDIRQRMEPLAPGEDSGPRPTAAAPPVGQTYPPDEMPLPPERRRGPWDGTRPELSAPEPAAGFGTLAIRVQPFDATLLVDGKEWAAPEGDGPVLIELSDGPHDIEVRKDGLPTYRRTVQVRTGRTLPLNVSLAR